MNNTKQQFGKRFQAVRELKHQTRLLLAQIKEATNQFGSTKKKLQAVQA